MKLSSAQYSKLHWALTQDQARVSIFLDNRILQALIKNGAISYHKEDHHGFSYRITPEGFRAMLRYAVNEYSGCIERGVEEIMAAKHHIVFEYTK